MVSVSRNYFTVLSGGHEKVKFFDLASNKLTFKTQVVKGGIPPFLNPPGMKKNSVFFFFVACIARMVS
ncbi:MAG: hypothetical protein CM15mP87_11220 [Candidatus Neomarinimicrobiota bacterium]|nr:MAG: hypothetical protein CM15mP87_11220 [Candidatus Neomarinimicrobiota bacterium]